MNVRALVTGLVVALVLSSGAASLAAAGERTLQLRTVEEPSLVDAAFCDSRSFPANVRLGATVWSSPTRAADGEVVAEQAHQVGTAAACARLTDFTFAPFGGAIPFAVRFDLRDGSYLAEGTCTITSNDVPVPRLVLAGCTLALDEAPEGVAGGSVTSASVFNPFRLPGFDTGSFWTLRLYTTD